MSSSSLKLTDCDQDENNDEPFQLFYRQLENYTYLICICKQKPPFVCNNDQKFGFIMQFAWLSFTSPDNIHLIYAANTKL